MNNTKCVLWDKTSDIKGFSKDYWFEKYPFFKNDDVMIEEICGVVSCITTVDCIRVKLRLSPELTSQEVIDIYSYNANNNLDQDPEQVKKWKESESELSQAKFILMKEGLL